MSEELRRELRRTILELVEERGPDRSICPSEAARACRDDWRDLMPLVRDIARELQAEGRVTVTQNGESVDPVQASGPIRLSVRSED